MLKLTVVCVLIALSTASPFTGGWIDSTVTPKVTEIAQWAASELSSETENHSVVRITNVQTQLVAGVNYKFNLELLVNNQVTKICRMNIFEQEWTNTRLFNEEPQCSVGGWSVSEVTPQVKEIASWAASQLAATSNDETHEVVEIRNVQTQLVSGMNYKFQLELLVANTIKKVCDLNIYDQPWTNTRVFNEDPKCYSPEPIMGSWKPSEVTPKVTEIANWAASQLSGDDSQHSVVKVTNVFTQLVNGLNYKFDIELLVNNQVTKVCHMNIYDQEWTNTRQFNEEPDCSVAAKRLGGWKDSEVTDKVKEIAAWSASELSSLSQQQHEVVTVKNVKTQVVAGVNYKFTLELLVNGKLTKTCELTVFDQPWSNTRLFLNEPKCSADSKRSVGGWQDAEIDDDVREIAAWASQELTGFMNQYFEGVNIKSVQKQIVNGINYRITLELTIGGKIFKECEMGIYDQSWTGIRYFFEMPKCKATKMFTGGWKDSEITDKVKEIAAWSASELSSLSQQQHEVVTVKNVKTQVVAGVNYKFTLELLVNGKETKTCELTVFDQPWTTTRKFLGEPKCSA